jgi:hypothetical protein
LWFTIKSCAHALIVRVHPPPSPTNQPKQNKTKQNKQQTKQNKTPEQKSHFIGALLLRSIHRTTQTATSMKWLFFFLPFVTNCSDLAMYEIPFVHLHFPTHRTDLHE